ncbi:hypothetical protein AVEN_53836-1 [Araneus ventricosus]|uniref:F-box domain-containing protein n=1 Tax=Araneus ventricosus TaxID=182803 RepID=A0A4Y2EYR0_ARAVE|nr:hypothetical protein AVEN_53836-1 [Araneus ventricosus]
MDNSGKYSDAVEINSVEMQELDKRTFESTTSTETEKYDKQGQWSELPLVPLENIYFYLNSADQTSISLVCRKWSEGFSSPSVWKRFRFDLKISELSLDTCSGIKFARKYSKMFRYVEINYHRIPNTRFFFDSWKHLKIFLAILNSNSQLLSIKFQGLEYYFEEFHLGYRNMDNL